MAAAYPDPNASGTYTLANAITLVKDKFLSDVSGRQHPTSAYATLDNDYATARTKWPELMNQASVIFALQNDSGDAVNTTNLTTALQALNINSYPNG